MASQISTTSAMTSATTSTSTTAITSSTTTATASTTQLPIPANVSLPTLLGTVPSILVYYDGQPFSGQRGSYCWVGTAITAQTNATATRNCARLDLPRSSTYLPTIAIYPNATVDFGFAHQEYLPTSYPRNTHFNFSASLFQSGSMRLVRSNGSVLAGFPLGRLPPGDYILSVNASYGRSYASSYYGIKQIALANYSAGSIKITLGSPSVQMETFGRTTSSGHTGLTLVRLETFTLNLSSSNGVRSVNLSSISVIDGTWVRFIPPYFSLIGPAGAQAKMLLVGSGEPAVKNDFSNVSMIIQTKANGAVLGEVALPLLMDGTGSSAVLHSLAPNQEFLSSAWNAFSANQQIFGVESIILEGATNSTSALPVAVSVVGLYGANGSLGPQPPWLQFTVPQSSSNLSISPDNPLDFQLDVDTTSGAPPGVYTVVVAIQIADQEFALLIPVEVGLPISTAAR